MKTMVLQFMLEGPPPCTVLYFNVHITVEYLKNAFLLVRCNCSNTFQSLLLFVQGQGQKGKQKHILTFNTTFTQTS